jgi:hypothetical protein
MKRKVGLKTVKSSKSTCGSNSCHDSVRGCVVFSKQIHRAGSNCTALEKPTEPPTERTVSTTVRSSVCERDKYERCVQFSSSGEFMEEKTEAIDRACSSRLRCADRSASQYREHSR